MRLHPKVPTLLIVALVAAAPLARAAVKETAKPATPAPSAAAAKPHGGMMGGGMTALALPGIPQWTPPAEYSVDMSMSSQGQAVTMHRSFKGESIRSEMEAEGQKMVMLERAEEPGVSWTLVAEQKMAMKMNPAKIREIAVEKGAKIEPADAPVNDVAPEIEKLGSETIDGHTAAKFKVSADGHSALMWFDAATGAPLRMESGEAKIEWKNLKVGPQPAKLFEIPKDYQVLDMEEQMKQMKSLGGGSMLNGMAGGAGAMGAAGGMKGMKLAGRGATGSAMSALGAGSGLPGGMPTSLEGAAGGYGQHMGEGFGQQIGSGIGASFGGPIGAMAGSYIGGKIGGWLGHRVATAVTPDIGPGASK